MAVLGVDNKGQLAASTIRGPSQAIWADCPVLDILQDPSVGYYFFDDFIMAGQWATTNTTGQSFGQWGSYGSTGALLVDDVLEGGVIGLNSDAADESATIASTVGAFKIVDATPFPLGRKLWFECRVAVSTIAATKMDVFCGLSDKLTSSSLMTNTLPISTTDDTLSTVPNLIGFHKWTSASTDWKFVYQVAGGTAVYPTGLTTLSLTVAGAAIIAATAAGLGFIKLGFVFDPTANPLTITTASTGQTAGVIATPMIRVYVNGLPAPAFLTAAANIQGATFPAGFMGPVFSTMMAATGAPTAYIDWIRVCQLANS